MPSSISIRAVDAGLDAGAIRQIYTHYVLHSFATFDEVPPTVSAMRDSISAVLDRQLPFIVAVQNEKVVGYASAKPFYGRSGFFPSVENSVYVAPGSIGKGVGGRLLEQLIYQCKTQDIMKIIALIGGGDANVASTKLHERFGFKRVGQIDDCGRKIGQLCAMSIYQLALKKPKIVHY